MKPILLDSGVIVALLDRGDQFHAPCAEAAQSLEAPLITCEAVIAESCHLLRRVPGAREAVLRNVAEGIFHIPFQLSQQAAAVEAMLRKYRDRGMDLADACLVALANEYHTGTILTLDRDFYTYRWGRNKPFHLLPARDQP